MAAGYQPPLDADLERTGQAMRRTADPCPRDNRRCSAERRGDSMPMICGEALLTIDRGRDLC